MKKDKEECRPVPGIPHLISFKAGGWIADYSRKNKKTCEYLNDTYIVMPRFGGSWPFRDCVVNAKEVYRSTWGEPLPKDAVLHRPDLRAYSSYADVFPICAEQSNLPGYTYLVKINRLMVNKLNELGIKISDLYENK